MYITLRKGGFMKNTIRKINNMKYTKLVIGIIIGVIIAGTSVYYAATIYYDSINVGYDNTVSGLDSTNVQDALDELDSRLNFGNATAANILSGKTALVGGVGKGSVTGWVVDVIKLLQVELQLLLILWLVQKIKVHLGYQ